MANTDVGSDNEDTVIVDPTRTFDESTPVDSEKQPSQTVENRAPIGDQFVINALENLVVSSSTVEEFLDPTTEFTPSNNSAQSFEDGESVSITRTYLEKFRIALVDCHDPSVTNAAVDALLGLFSQNISRRQLLFEGINESRSDSINLAMFEDASKRTRIGAGGCNMVLIVRLHSNAQTFVDSMSGSQELVDQISRVLLSNNIYIICTVDSYRIRDMVQPKDDKTDFYSTTSDPIVKSYYYWQIDFLGPCISAAFDTQKQRYLTSMISQQAEVGLWGNGTSREFYLLIKGFIDQGALIDEVEKRSKYDGGSVSDFLLSISRTEVSSLFPQDQLTRVVMFVATFFPKLTRPEFNYVIRSLLADRHWEDRSLSTNSEQGDLSIEGIHDDKPFLEIWNENSDSIFANNGLTIVSDRDGRETVEFLNPMVPAALSSHLRQQFGFFIGEQFRRLWDSGLLLEGDAPKSVLDNIISLSVELARTDPIHFGMQRLVDMVVRLRTIQDGHQHKAEAHAKQIRIIARLSDLLREMWSDTKLREMIKKFLNSLIENQHSDVALELVLRTTSRLRYSAEFDSFYWIKQLLDRGHQESHDRAVDALYKLALQSDHRIYDLFTQLAEWLPTDQIDAAKYPRSSKDVLRLIAVYSIQTFETLQESEFGAWPPTYPLFRTLGDDQESRERLRFLLSSIQHHALPFALIDGLVSDIDLDLRPINLELQGDILSADIVERWFQVLRGNDKNSVHPDALILARILVEEFKRTKTMIKYKELLRFWQRKLDIYRSEVANHTAFDREQRHIILAKIRSLYHLRYEFKSIDVQVWS